MANSVHPVIWLAVLVTLLVDTSDASWSIYRLCWYDGRFHKPGSVFPAIDGCNTCTCTTLGTVVCTKKACIPAPVCPTPIGGGVCVEQCSRDEDCFAGQKCCSNGCGHVCTTIQNCAAIQCDVPKCDFPTGAVATPPAGWCCPGCGCRIGGGKVVRIGESYKIGCNQCTCTMKGPICTRIACPLPGGKG